MTKEMRQRILFGGTALVLVAICIAFAQLIFFRLLIGLAVLFLGGAAVWEFYTLAERKGLHLPTRLGILSSLFYLLVAFCSTQGWLYPVAQGLALALAALVIWSFYLFRGKDPILSVPMALFGLLYGAVCFGFLFNILFASSSMGRGQWWLIYLLGVAILNDIGGYFVGSRWGKRPLAPRVSPRKSWEGAIGGFILGIIGGLVVHLCAPSYLSLASTLLYGAILSVAAQLGDLAESLLKRDVGVKDSNSIPNFGGVLDVLDGLLFVLPLGYLFSLAPL